MGAGDQEHPPLARTSSFLFTACQVGAERALKAELAREHPSLRPAFSRPGFVTFKSEDPLGPDLHLRSIFARAFGLCHERLDLSAMSEGEAALRVVRLAQSLILGPDPGTHLHVFHRDRHPPGEDPSDADPGAERTNQIARDIRAADTGVSPFLDPAQPRAGEPIIDLIDVDDLEWWVGWHLHSVDHSPFPGGRPAISLPREAPSRAYLKLEEALLWSGAPLAAGDTAVELGSAPGGAVYALLSRGLKVIGIDPAEMDIHLLGPNASAFRHLRRAAGSVIRDDLPRAVHWLLLDMNVEPRIALPVVERIVGLVGDSLLGVLLTLKLNDWNLAPRIPAMLARIRNLGIEELRTAQLASHRREFVVYGLTARGVSRRLRASSGQLGATTLKP